MNKAFDERLEWGQELEAEVVKSFNRHGLTSFPIPNVNPIVNRRAGDLLVLNPISRLPIRLDAKRSPRINRTSIEDFTGTYYLISSDGSLNEDKWVVIPSSTVKAYAEHLTEWTMYSDGTEFLYIDLETYRNQEPYLMFVNRLITANHPLGNLY